VFDPTRKDPQWGRRKLARGIDDETRPDADGLAKNEADHFMKCPGCAQWFDMCDLEQVFEHLHEQHFEIEERPKSH
jgi:hypothetical protein